MPPSFPLAERIRIIAVAAVMILILTPNILRSIERKRVFRVAEQVSAMRSSVVQPGSRQPSMPVKGPWPGSAYTPGRSGNITLSGVPIRSASDIDLAIDGAANATGGIVRYDDTAQGSIPVFFILSAEDAAP